MQLFQVLAGTFSARQPGFIFLEKVQGGADNVTAERSALGFHGHPFQPRLFLFRAIDEDPATLSFCGLLWHSFPATILNEKSLASLQGSLDWFSLCNALAENHTKEAFLLAIRDAGKECIAIR
jgi:hypothetical protein